MNAFEIATQGTWTNALSIASLGFVSDAIAVEIVPSFRGSGGGLYSIFNNIPVATENVAVRQQNNLILAIAAAAIGSGVLN